MVGDTGCVAPRERTDARIRDYSPDLRVGLIGHGGGRRPGADDALVGRARAPPL